MSCLDERQAKLADFVSCLGLVLVPEVLICYCEGCALLLLSALNLCKYARKMRGFCIIKKVIFLCFQVLLSFVPTIFHFLYFPGSPAALGPWRIPRPLAHLVAAQGKLSINYPF
jgi:hypothetical protein